jgi:hypothetical protein
MVKEKEVLAERASKIAEEAQLRANEAHLKAVDAEITFHPHTKNQTVVKDNLASSQPAVRALTSQPRCVKLTQIFILASEILFSSVTKVNYYPKNCRKDKSKRVCDSISFQSDRSNTMLQSIDYHQDLSFQSSKPVKSYQVYSSNIYEKCLTGSFSRGA